MSLGIGRHRCASWNNVNFRPPMCNDSSMNSPLGTITLRLSNSMRWSHCVHTFTNCKLIMGNSIYVEYQYLHINITQTLWRHCIENRDRWAVNRLTRGLIQSHQTNLPTRGWKMKLWERLVVSYTIALHVYHSEWPLTIGLNISWQVLAHIIVLNEMLSYVLLWFFQFLKYVYITEMFIQDEPEVVYLFISKQNNILLNQQR